MSITSDRPETCESRENGRGGGGKLQSAHPLAYPLRLLLEQQGYLEHREQGSGEASGWKRSHFAADKGWGFGCS